MAPIREAGRRAVLWSAGIGAALPLLPIVFAEDKPACSESCSGMIRPSQLPIYGKPEDLFDVAYHVSEKGQLEEGVKVVREELTEALETTKELRDQLDHIYQTGKAHTAGQIEYLLDEKHVGARAGAIAAGGLVGLMLGARKKGGLIKKLLYTTVGVGASSAALYPQYSKQYSEDLVTNANTYATVAYNFVSGVKPQALVEPPPAAPVVERSKSVVESEAKKEGAERRASEGKAAGVGAEVDHGQSNPHDADMYTTRS